MKRAMCTVLAALLLTPALAAAELVSVAQLRAQAQALGGRWTQTYTAHGRTIEVDAPVSVPDVQAMPVLTARAVPAISERTAERLGETGAFSLEERNRETAEKWPFYAFEYASADGMTTLSGWHFGGLCLGYRDLCVPETAAARTTVEQRIPGCEADPDRAYAENSSLTVRQILLGAQKALALLYPDMPVTLAAKDVFVAHNWYHTDEAEALGRADEARKAGAGRYELYVRQTLRGIPLLMGILDVCEAEEAAALLGDPGFYERLRFEPYHAMNGQETVSARSIGDMEIVVEDLRRETGVLAQDVPLASLDQVLRAVEAQIEAGHIRRVHALSLGYGEFLHGQSATEMALYPVWLLECDWMDDPQQEVPQSGLWKGMRDQSGAAYAVRMITAQDAAFRPQGEMTAQQLGCPQIATWDAVR